MKRLLIIAPHPDDETLGCGGTILRANRDGSEVYWLLVTNGISASRAETDAVAEALGVHETVRLGHPAAKLDTLPLNSLIGEIGAVVQRLAPTDMYLPFRRDAHTDHAVVFDAGIAAAKWFRYESVRRVLAYETQSETDFDLSPDSPGFHPNVFVNITETIERKIRVAEIYNSEFHAHPFPRSLEGLRALATLRGAAAGFVAAEAFMLLRERV